MRYALTGLAAEPFYWAQQTLYKDDKKTPKDPIFIIGHWRSGTTYLHTLLVDFNKASTIRNTFSICPQAALMLKPIFKRLKVSPTRSIDWVPWSMNDPQELDLALLRVTNNMPHYSNCMGEDFGEQIKIWCREDLDTRFRNNLVKIMEWAWIHDGVDGQPFILKTPALTCHIPTILNVWPNARFVYINREKGLQESFEKILTIFHEQYGCWRLDGHNIDNSAAKSIRYLKKRFNDTKKMIPKGNLIEITYEELIDSPQETIKKANKIINKDKFEDRLSGK